MHTLTADQQIMLLEILNEKFGSDLEFEEFSDVLLGLFEDIPGFEASSQKTTDRLIKHFWSKYHDQIHQEV